MTHRRRIPSLVPAVVVIALATVALRAAALLLVGAAGYRFGARAGIRARAREHGRR